MNRLPTILNSGITCALIFILVTITFPNFSVQAAPPPLIETPVASKLTCNTGRSVQVSGTAVVNVSPDRVLIQLGVQSNATTPNKVETANTKTINRVIRSLKALGIDEKNIVTDWYVIDPIYDDYDPLTIEGYRINNIIAITLRDITTLVSAKSYLTK